VCVYVCVYGSGLLMSPHKIYLSLYLSIYLSIYRSIYLSIYILYNIDTDKAPEDVEHPVGRRREAHGVA
jgi:hypothetical protein